MIQNPAIKGYAASVILDYFLHLDFAARVLCDSIPCQSFQEFRGAKQQQGTKQGEVVRGNIRVAYNFHGAGGEVVVNDRVIHFDVVVKDEYNLTSNNVKPFVCADILTSWGMNLDSFWKACEEMDLITRNFPPDDLPPIAREIEGYGGYKASWIKGVLPNSVLWKNAD